MKTALPSKLWPDVKFFYVLRCTKHVWVLSVCFTIIQDTQAPRGWGALKTVLMRKSATKAGKLVSHMRAYLASLPTT